MRLLVAAFAIIWSVPAWAGQPSGIRLEQVGVSAIYPVFDSSGWLMTQPDAGRMSVYPDPGRVTHWEDEYYAQDWARGCGQTAGLRLYAGISGQVALAGSRGPYGLTVVIHDSETGFALKYSHLSEVSVRDGEFVLAGQSLVGRVGNTGNVSGGCQSSPGAHLHLALFRNVKDPRARPVAVTAARVGQAPSHFAAPFGYATPVALAKSASGPAVFAVRDGVKTPVSREAFVSNGWDFDQSRRVFDALAGNVWPDSRLGNLATAPGSWPLRDHSLLRSSNSRLVYQFEDGRKYAVSATTFACRGLRFGEVLEVRPADRDLYFPLDDVESMGCEPKPRRAVSDMIAFAARKGLARPDLSSYRQHYGWHPDRELRSMWFRTSSGSWAEVYRQDLVGDPSQRWLAYRDQASGLLTDWERVR